ncbi:MAG: hypothetical protein OXR73_02830 [Myxococcales bacterium]|nr:hypothetical protein [Myxococcales bacterium]
MTGSNGHDSEAPRDAVDGSETQSEDPTENAQATSELVADGADLREVSLPRHQARAGITQRGHQTELSARDRESPREGSTASPASSSSGGDATTTLVGGHAAPPEMLDRARSERGSHPRPPAWEDVRRTLRQSGAPDPLTDLDVPFADEVVAAAGDRSGVETLPEPPGAANRAPAEAGGLEAAQAAAIDAEIDAAIEAAMDDMVDPAPSLGSAAPLIVDAGGRRDSGEELVVVGDQIETDARGFASNIAAFAAPAVAQEQAEAASGSGAPGVSATGASHERPVEPPAERGPASTVISEPAPMPVASGAAVAQAPAPRLRTMTTLSSLAPAEVGGGASRADGEASPLMAGLMVAAMAAIGAVGWYWTQNGFLSSGSKRRSAAVRLPVSTGMQAAADLPSAAPDKGQSGARLATMAEAPAGPGPAAKGSLADEPGLQFETTDPGAAPLRVPGQASAPAEAAAPGPSKGAAVAGSTVGGGGGGLAAVPAQVQATRDGKPRRRRAARVPAPAPAPRPVLSVRPVDTSISPFAGDLPAESVSADYPPTPSRQEVVAAMTRVRGLVHACSDGRSGVAEVELVVQSRGVVSRAVVGGDFAGSAVGSCIARAVRKARFPAFQKPTFRIVYPFRL